MAVTSTTIKPRAPERRRALFTTLATISTYVLALIALIVLAQRGTAWVEVRLDDLRYGMPRTVHLNGVVSDSDTIGMPTRFVGLNLDGQINVLVVPSSDPEQITVLSGPYVIGRDGATVVPHLQLADLTGDGQADLLLTIRGETVVYVNQSGSFSLITAEERARLEQQAAP